MKFAVAAVVAIILIAGCASSQGGVSKEEFDEFKARVMAMEDASMESTVDISGKSQSSSGLEGRVSDLEKYFELVYKSINIDYNVSLLLNNIQIMQYTISSSTAPDVRAIRRVCNEELPKAKIVLEKVEKTVQDLVDNRDLILKVEGKEFAESAFERYTKNVNGSLTTIRSTYNSGKATCSPGAEIVEAKYNVMNIRNKNDANVETSKIKVFIKDTEIKCSWAQLVISYYQTATCGYVGMQCASGTPVKVVFPTGEEATSICS